MAVFLFYGEDTYSQKEKLKFWQAEFEKKYGGNMNVTVFDGRYAAANEIFQACSSMPFLSDKRFTIVKDFLAKRFGEEEEPSEEKAIMADLIEKIPDFCILVFSESVSPDRRISLYKKIKKIGKLMEFSAMGGSKLLGWIQKIVEKKGGTIEKDALIFLSEFVTADLYKTENEIAKFVGYAKDRAINKDDIILLMDTQLTTNIFKLTDGIGQKNRKVALDTLHNLIDNGEELHGILYMIMRQFRIITMIKDLVEQRFSRDQITIKLKLHPFVVSNTISQVRNFSMEQLKRAYKLLIKIDTKLKSGGIKVLAGDNREFVLAMDRLVLDLC
ncbi:DNA polymerase III subunit delta [Candidatus Peregrinibacteria bacterium]|nr:DNA polymerase III subunit delta [Candidatus Peregrinibacteria bacterium]